VCSRHRSISAKLEGPHGVKTRQAVFSREISLTVGMSADDCLELVPEKKPLVLEIPRQKEAPLKKSTSRVLSANARFSWWFSLRSVDSRGFSEV
jgi:hypothetical protein